MTSEGSWDRAGRLDDGSTASSAFVAVIGPIAVTSRGEPPGGCSSDFSLRQENRVLGEGPEATPGPRNSPSPPGVLWSGGPVIHVTDVGRASSGKASEIVR